LELLCHYKTTSILGGPSPKEAEAIERIAKVVGIRYYG